MMQLSTSLSQDEHLLPRIKHDWHVDLVNFVEHGLPKIVVALLIAFVLWRLTRFFVDRLRYRADRLVGNSQRASQLRTIAGIIRATAYAFIGTYFILQALSAIGVPLGPFIASAGVIGLGVSFGAQSIFKDMLNGIFILVENQYNVGDVVKIAGLTGTVENLTLRCTTLRDGDGTVYIVPNSQIATVSNQSRDFSIAALSVSADASADPDRVLTVLQQLTEEVRADEAFKQVIIGDAGVTGVDKINGREVQYTINVRVQANQRDGVLRELRRRVLKTFERQNIMLGTAASTLVMPRTDPTAPPAQRAST